LYSFSSDGYGITMLTVSLCVLVALNNLLVAKPIFKKLHVTFAMPCLLFIERKPLVATLRCKIQLVVILVILNRGCGGCSFVFVLD
jgi:hypothetical protein